jgi:dCMP deaminase
VPRGQVPCLLRYSSDLLNQKKGTEAFSAFETGNADFKKALVKKNLASAQEEEREGRHLTYCFRAVYNDLKGEKNQVHTRSLHAEENAFLQVVKYGGQGIRGGILFTTASPCELCAKKAYQLGISAIYYIDPYPGISADHVLGAGKDVPKVVLFSGVIGRAYHELYEPIMAFKDELATLLPTQGQPAEDVAPEQGTLFDAQTSGTLRAK